MRSLHAQTWPTYRVGRMCGLLGISRQAYYKEDDSKRMAKYASEELAVQFAKEVRAKDPGIGGKKIWHMYMQGLGRQYGIGRDRFYAILDGHGMKLRQKRRKPRTTDSRHDLPKYPNLIRDYIPDRPNRLWVSDITYVPIIGRHGELRYGFLSVILDGYSEMIKGWSIIGTLETAGPAGALRMALDGIGGRSMEGLIHHSDRGCQYASGEYTDMLKARGIRISMTESGNPKDNAQAERINNTIKNELLKGKTFRTMEEARAALADAIDFYNYERPHLSLGMLTPAEAEGLEGELNMNWRSYRREAIRAKGTALV